MVGTGVDVRIGGKPEWGVLGYSVVEDSTSVDPGDMSGGFGQLNLNIRDTEEAMFLSGKQVNLTDGTQGELVATVKGQSGDGLDASITADARLGQTAVRRSMPPFVGRLEDGIRTYLAACGITEGVVVDAEIGDIPVQLVGWAGIVYDQLKKLCSAHQIEMSVVSSNIVFRKLRERIAVNYRDADVSWSIDDTELAQTVVGVSYNTRIGTELAWPERGFDPERVQTYQVAANEVVVLDLPISASLSHAVQPVCVSSIQPGHASSSVYTVLGADESVVSPAAWAAAGGHILVEVGEDTRSLIVTITGPTDVSRSPYRIAAPTPGQDRQYFSTLRIQGTGVFYDREDMILTGTPDPDLAPSEVGQTVDNEFMSTPNQLYHALLHTSARYGTPQQGINVRTRGINRVGESGSARYPTIGDVNDMWPGWTIGNIQDVHPNWTIGDWNDFMLALVSNDFDNQAFGNIAGARVRHGASWYRIRSATVTELGINYRADRDNIIGDVYHTGESIGEWNDRWAGKTIQDVNIAPLLERAKAPLILEGYGSGGYGEDEYGSNVVVDGGYGAGAYGDDEYGSGASTGGGFETWTYGEGGYGE